MCTEVAGYQTNKQHMEIMHSTCQLALLNTTLNVASPGNSTPVGFGSVGYLFHATQFQRIFHQVLPTHKLESVKNSKSLPTNMVCEAAILLFVFSLGQVDQIYLFIKDLLNSALESNFC